MAESPFTAPTASLEIETPLKESDYVKAFLLYFVCALIAGTLGGGAVGLIFGTLWGGSSIDSPALRTLVLAASVVVAVLLNYAMFRFAVKELIVPKLSGVRNDAA